MKKNRASESGLLTWRIFIALTLCSGSAWLAQFSFAQAPATRTPVYQTGNFSFGAPKQLIPGNPLLGFQDVEPEIKVDIFGNIYVTAIEGVPAGVDLWKSTDGGATFAYLGQPDGAQCPTGQTCTNDAGIGGGDDSIDVSTGGYLYVSSLWLGNVTMSMSMDGGTGGIDPGQKWEVNPVAAGVPVDDRQWIAAYGPQTVYMSYRQTPGSNVIFVAKSTDAGKTFPQVVATFPATNDVLARREGNLVVDPYNGNIYTSFRPQELNGHTRAELWFLKSTDGGLNWSLSKAYQGPAGTDIGNVFPVMAVDRGGNIHLAFSQCDYNSVTQNSSNCGVYLTSSTDQGNTWLSPVKVNSGAETAYAIMPWIVAGSPGVVDITWYGANITSSTQAANWHVYFAQTTNALAASPVFNQVQAVAQIVHNQDICLKGGACGGNRDLAEYYTITLDPDGNANIAFTDDVNNNTSGFGRTWFTKQTSGTKAYAPPIPPAASTFAPNVALPNSGGKAEPNVAVDSFNCIFSAAPGGANLWKSIDNGLTFTKLPNVPVLPNGGHDEDIVPLPATTRPAILYYADLALSDVSVRKSLNGGTTWFSPGAGGSAGELNASSDRQWIAYDFLGNTLNMYEMDHELVSEDIRFASSTDDSAWVTVSGITDPVLLLDTVPNTNPGPVFVNHADHTVYGIFTSSIPTTNANRPPFGKLPDVWIAAGAGTTGTGFAPGPFTNYPVFKGVIDSPTTPAPPPGSTTYGTNAANDFPGGDVDSAGNVYAVWAMNNARTNQYAIWFAASHDGGKNFYGPFQVSSGPGSAEMPWIAAGDAGRADIVYYNSTDSGDPNTSNLHWTVKFAQSLNADTRQPVFTISDASDHIMHYGPICNLGLLCSSGTRVLLDFFEVAIGPDGLANIVYADTGNANSPSHLTYARQTSGPLALNNPVTRSCVPRPDLIVTNLTATSNQARQGQKIPLTATVKNQGEVNAGASKTGFYLDGKLIGEVDTPAVSPGQSVTATLNWDTAGVKKGNHQLQAVADDTKLVLEIDENNNRSAILTIYIQGNRT
jgi:hypothetical protein